MRTLLLAMLHVTSSLHLTPTLLRTYTPHRCTLIHAAVGSPTEVKAAADAVKKVAAKFGAAQATAAKTWVDAAISSDGCVTSSLVDEQLVLFEECLLDDPGGKCKELDEALTAFETSLTDKAKPESKMILGFRIGGSTSTKERAAARVRSAAAKFGKTQGQVAKDWVDKAVLLGAPEGGPSLMEQQLALFGTCELQDDGSVDPKCVALYEALDNLQVVLTGSVAAPTTGPVSSATSSGATQTGKNQGQAGQFKVETAARNNGCWPYN